MDKYLFKIIARYSLLLIAILFLDEFLIYFSGINIPKYIPNTPININGLVLILIHFFLLLKALKGVLRHKAKLRIIQLTFVGFIICLISELFFQTTINIIERTESLSDRIYFILKPTFTISAIFTLISLLISFQIKAKRNGPLLK